MARINVFSKFFAVVMETLCMLGTNFNPELVTELNLKALEIVICPLLMCAAVMMEK